MTGDMTPSWLVWVFNSYASLAILFIIIVLFCFFFEHETIHTALVLAVFDFYYRTYACNLTECENPQNSDCPFPLLFEDFRLCSSYNNVNYGTWHVYKTLFGSSNAICRLDCSEISLSKKKKKNGEKSRIWYNSADGVTAWARLYVLCIHILFAGWEVCMVKNCDLGLHSISLYGPTLRR